MSEGRFESGVYGYVKGECTVTVYFPVDKNGVPDISCKQCEFYRVSSRSCGLNGKVIPYGEKFVGPFCPFRPVNDKEILPADSVNE